MSASGQWKWKAMYETSSTSRSVPYVTIPQAAPGEIGSEPVGALRAGHRDARVPFRVDAAVEVLKEGDIRREHVLHDGRVDGAQRAQARDDPCEQHHGGVSRVLLHARVVEREQFVACGGESHDSLPVDGAIGRDVPAREFEGKLCAHALFFEDVFRR